MQRVPVIRHARTSFDDELVSCVPPTPGELAAASVRWERRGLISRLVRADAGEETRLPPAA
jgi:hypothetical protein